MDEGEGGWVIRGWTDGWMVGRDASHVLAGGWQGLNEILRTDRAVGHKSMNLKETSL